MAIVTMTIDPTSAKAQLDAMADTDRGYIKTSPIATQFPIVSLERTAAGLVEVKYDDEAIV